jgi:hypothetical protein
LVNTIPKSGTYFVEAALNAIGCLSQRLHLSGYDSVDDYRGLPDQEVHVAPELVRLVCPVNLVTALLKGEHVVGHIEHRSVIEEIRTQNVCVIYVTRNLRDVLASLLRFKLTKVAPKDPVDGFWRDLSRPKQVIAFLLYHHEKDLAHIRALAELMVSDQNAIFLRYEQICAGEIAPETAARLDMMASGISGCLSKAFKNQYGRVNPTYSGRLSQWRDIWDDAVERYFIASGLADLNRALAYE